MQELWSLTPFLVHSVAQSTPQPPQWASTVGTALTSSAADTNAAAINFMEDLVVDITFLGYPNGFETQSIANDNYAYLCSRIPRNIPANIEPLSGAIVLTAFF